jgi:hypothetical protein
VRGAFERLEPRAGKLASAVFRGPRAALPAEQVRYGVACMTKNELLAALTNTWQNFAFGLLLPKLVLDDAWHALAGKTITFDGPNGPWFHISPIWYKDVIENPANRQNLIGEFEKSLKRALVSEGHELILSYCEATNQVDLYKAVPWFQFARIMRNVVSHKQGGTLREWPNDLRKKGITQVSWRKRTIDINMIGREIEFTHQEALQLLADQFEFAQNQLK